MASSSSSRYGGDTVDAERRLTALEQRLAALEKQLAATVPGADGWERMQAYAKRNDVSIRTVDRDVERGVLEKRRDPGTNRSYVRRVRSEQSARPQRRRLRGMPIAGDEGDAAVPESAAPGDAVWPFRRLDA
jgi:hypothetical protein